MSNRASAQQCEYFPIVGGNWNNAADAGLWNVNVNNAASNANSNIGARLANDNIGQKAHSSRARVQCQSFGADVQAHRAEDQSRAAASSAVRVERGCPQPLRLRTAMPRTVSGLYEQIVSYDNLYAAYLAARKGKRYRGAAATYGAHLEENLINLHNHLVWRTWRPGRAHEFRVYEPKQRDIQAPPFADRIVHHALVRVVEPIFERGFIHHSYACRKGKGAQRAVAAVQGMLRSAQAEYGTRDLWVIKADIKAYFASIGHDTLFRLIRRRISCPQTLALWRAITRGYGHDHGLGVPVGALTSQLDGNIVMDHLDHAVTDHAGVGRYVRYMDDTVVILPGKAAAQAVLALIDDEVTSLGLRLNPKTSIRPAHAGIDFAGYRIWATHILPRKRNVVRARKMLKRTRAQYATGALDLAAARARLMSYLAYAKHCNAHNTTQAILDELVLIRRHPEPHP